MATPKKKTLIVVQTGSKTAISPSMKQTLVGLGLGKPRSKRELEDTAAVRGMVRKVRHLVEIEGEGKVQG
jgi:large subunit ribosomal protein L30